MNWQRAKDRIVGAVVFVLFDVRVQIPDVEEEGTFAQIDFVIHKAKLLERLKGRINGRQEKVLLRMLREGPEGFEGGMSAKKYSTIAETAPATTTRDLAGLVEVGALIRSGELKYTRYELNIPVSNIPSITIDEAGRVHSKMTEG